MSRTEVAEHFGWMKLDRECTTLKKLVVGKEKKNTIRIACGYSHFIKRTTETKWKQLHFLTSAQHIGSVLSEKKS